MADNLINSVHMEIHMDEANKYQYLMSTLAQTPFISNTSYMQCNSGTEHTEIISLDEAKTRQHILGDARIASTPTGNATFRFYTDRRASDLALEAEQYDLLQRLEAERGKAASQGIKLDDSKMKTLQRELNTVNNMIQNRLRNIWYDMEKWSFNGIQQAGEDPNRIIGLSRILGRENGKNVQKAVGGHVQAGQANSHSAYILNLNHCNILYPSPMDGVLEIGNWQRVADVSKDNNNKANKKEHFWWSSNIGFGVRAIEDLKYGRYGCARLCNIKLNSPAGSAGSFAHESVRAQFNKLARKVACSNLSNGSFIYVFVGTDLYEDMQQAYTGINAQGVNTGVQFQPRLITDINVRTDQMQFKGFSQNSYFPINNNVIVMETSGLEAPELSI